MYMRQNRNIRKFGLNFLLEREIINPIPAGVLENQDMLGGGQFDPPPPL